MSSNQPIFVCEKWLKLNARIQALTLRWAEVENSLARDYDWLKLTENAQDSLSEAHELREIDAHLDELFRQREELSALVLKLNATSYDAIASKLTVLAALVDPEDHPTAHNLVISTVNELRALNVNRRRRKVQLRLDAD